MQDWCKPDSTPPDDEPGDWDEGEEDEPDEPDEPETCMTVQAPLSHCS